MEVAVAGAGGAAPDPERCAATVARAAHSPETEGVRCLPTRLLAVVVVVVLACDQGTPGSSAELFPGLAFVEVRDPALDATRTASAGAGVDWFSGGVVFRDLDGDGEPDLLVARTSGEDAALEGVVLLRGQGGGEFEDVTERSAVDYRGPAVAAAAADVDGDGRVDLYIATDGDGDRLYRQLDGFVFEEVSLVAGVRGAGRRSRSATFLDYDGDGWLDLYVTDWNDRGPLGMDGGATSWDAPNVLYRNAGDGTFTDVTERAGVDCFGRSSLGVAAADLDGDGDVELYVANEFFDDCFYENLGDGTFVDAAARSGVGHHANGGMGVAIGDPDSDGDLDLLVTDDTYDDGAIGNPFYENAGDLRFENQAQAWGLEGAASVGQPSSAVYWGAGFVDFDLDGVMDLHLAQHATGPDHLLRFDAEAGRYARVPGAPFEENVDVRGSAYADVDQDGRVDIAEVARGGPLRVLRNVGGAGNDFLRVRLEGTRGNPEGIGALVRVTACGRTTAHAVQAGSSYLSSSEPIVTAGVGSCTERIEVEVVFPGGQLRHRLVRAGRLVTVAL